MTEQVNLARLDQSAALAWVVAQLVGCETPYLLPLPGRRHLAHDAPLPADEREALLHDQSAPDAEVALVLCVSRQRVAQLRQAMRERQLEDGR